MRLPGSKVAPAGRTSNPVAWTRRPSRSRRQRLRASRARRAARPRGFRSTRSGPSNSQPRRAALARADLAVLSRSQNLSPASDPAAQCRPAGTVRRIFTRKTGFVTLDRLLARLHANKPELLMVLDRPEIPLHTNGSENDVPLPGHQAKDQRRYKKRHRTRLSRRFRRPQQDLRKTRHHLLGISRLTAGSAQPHRNPVLADNCQASLRHSLTRRLLPLLRQTALWSFTEVRGKSAQFERMSPNFTPR